MSIYINYLNNLAERIIEYRSCPLEDRTSGLAEPENMRDNVNN